MVSDSLEVVLGKRRINQKAERGGVEKIGKRKGKKEGRKGRRRLFLVAIMPWFGQ